MGILGLPNHRATALPMESAMYILITESPKQRSMFIAKSKRALKATIDTATRNNWVWRLHDGSGWCDESDDDAWRTIDSVTEPCMARVIY